MRYYATCYIVSMHLCVKWQIIIEHLCLWKPHHMRNYTQKPTSCSFGWLATLPSYGMCLSWMAYVQHKKQLKSHVWNFCHIAFIREFAIKILLFHLVFQKLNDIRVSSFRVQGLAMLYMNVSIIKWPINHHQTLTIK